MTQQGDRPPGDRILVRGLEFYGYHGVHPEEQKLGQRFRVDAALWLDLAPAAAGDDLEATVSYSWVYEQIAAVMTGAPSRLLEHAAGRIGQALLADRRVARVRVRIWKRAPPIAGMASGEAGVVLTFTQPLTTT